MAEALEAEKQAKNHGMFPVLCLFSQGNTIPALQCLQRWKSSLNLPGRGAPFLPPPGAAGAGLLSSLPRARRQPGLLAAGGGGAVGSFSPSSSVFCGWQLCTPPDCNRRARLPHLLGRSRSGGPIPTASRCGARGPCRARRAARQQQRQEPRGYLYRKLRRGTSYFPSSFPSGSHFNCRWWS